MRVGKGEKGVFKNSGSVRDLAPENDQGPRGCSLVKRRKRKRKRGMRGGERERVRETGDLGNKAETQADGKQNA